MTLEQDDVTSSEVVVDHGLNTAYVAEKYGISHLRIRQLAREYRETALFR